MRDDDLTLLDRYLADECTPAERAEIERRLVAEPAQQDLVGWMRMVKGAAKRVPSGWDGGTLWSDMQQRIVADGEGKTRPQVRMLPTRSTSRRLTWGLRAAAAIAIATAGVATWRMTEAHRAPSAVTAGRTFKTQLGERAIFRLIDGTMVTLAAGSTLEISGTYDAGSRDVYLHGRAYFEVVHNPRSPFRVHTGAMTTRVLGTRFGVQAYVEDSVMSVVVAEGSVAVQDNAPLVPGDRARMDRSGRVRVEHGVDVQRELAWTHGRLEFDNTPFRDVVPELERWYDLEIRLAVPSLGNRPLTASLEESASEVVALLATSLNVRYDWQGRVVTFYPK